MRMPAFTKSIHFRLTIWYSAILISLTILLIIGLNIGVRQASMEPPMILAQFNPGQNTPREIFDIVRHDQLELLRNYSIIGICCLTILGGVSIYFLSRKMLKPVDRVSSLAARISSTNLKERINHQGPDDEIKRLADTFDSMLGRLESAFESQKQFIQDASHELRTPIAIAQTNIEVMEMDDRATIKDYERLKDIIKINLERMSTLSEKLLLLSESEQSVSNWATVDLAPLLTEITAELKTRSDEKGVKIELASIENSLPILGDAFRLKQAFVNLVDNAIKYNKPGGDIKISARTDDMQVVIEIKDNGIGISQADQQRIFERFYRVDKSRSRAQGGSGLGLAIVKKIAEEHGGTISVESTLGEGSTFRITLPQRKID
ncbi:MAG: HAMP domain-containing sensor histidine kinase [Dehalococcoidia bacterium]|jgi:signal transduction histidine kinase